jgi:hypothetical protein
MLLEGGASLAGGLSAEPARPSEGDDTVASRQCGRCRAMFPGDATLHPTSLPEWWLCPACRLALLGTKLPKPAATQPAPNGAHDAR